MKMLTIYFTVFAVLFVAICGSTQTGVDVVKSSAGLEQLVAELRDQVNTLQTHNDQLRANYEELSKKVYDSQPGLSKREKTSTNDCSTTSKCKPSSWLRGRPGRDGRDGRDGEPGPAGRPGKDGRDGHDGQHGPVGPPGKNGLSAKQLESYLEKARKSIKLGLVGRKNSGAVYVRWGRTTCPPHSKLVYDGYAGGPSHTHKGGGSTKICLSKTPEFRAIKPGFQSHSYIYGAEYEVGSYNPFSNKNTRGHALYEADVVCAVCLATSRVSHVMIPGKRSCPKGWTREYNGYLMSERYSHHRSSYDCMDIAPEVRNGGSADKNGALFYVVEADCGYSLPCPPYKKGAELTCVVCTR